MKNRNKIFTTVFLAVVALFTAACEKDDETANVSSITTYAEFTMAGDMFMSVVQGQAFNDPGVTATEGDQELAVSTTGTVDVGTVGVYEIVYSATNSDGFPGTVTRTVAVIPAPEQPGTNISGTYARGSVTTTVTKLAPGFYRMGNIFGGSVIPTYIITSNGTDLILPLSELSGFGPSIGTGTLSADGTMTLTISLLAQAEQFQNFERIWKRQ